MLHAGGKTATERHIYSKTSCLAIADSVSRNDSNRPDFTPRVPQLRSPHIRPRLSTRSTRPLMMSAIPQGTSKEYIGDDTEEIKKAVKHALQQCCLQLKAHLLRRNALRDQKERKKVLTKVRGRGSLGLIRLEESTDGSQSTVVIVGVHRCPWALSGSLIFSTTVVRTDRPVWTGVPSLPLSSGWVSRSRRSAKIGPMACVIFFLYYRSACRRFRFLCPANTRHTYFQ